MIFKRILAFLIDYLLIILYAGLLLLATYLLIDANSSSNMSPIKGQVIGFITLTLPVFLYFWLFETSRYRATFGKRFMQLEVNEITRSKKFKTTILKRNILKLLPWEVAHFGVHWLIYYNNVKEDVPLWVFVVLIIPQIVVLSYFISLMFYKGKQTLYDKICGVEINHKP